PDRQRHDLRAGTSPRVARTQRPLRPIVGAGWLRTGQGTGGVVVLKTFIQLLGEDAPVLRRYIWMALFYGLLCGLTIVTLVPVLTSLLGGDVRAAGQWLIVLLIGVVVCWALRRTVEKAGIRVGIAVLQRGRHRLGDHVARLPVGWFTAQNTARLSHVASQGMMEVAQLPAHVFTPLITGVVTPVVILIALFAL